MSKISTPWIEDLAITEAKINTNAVTTGKINADAVDKTKIAADVAGDGLVQAAGGELDVNVDGTTIEIATDVVGVIDGSIGATQINEGDDYTWTGTHDYTGGTVSVATPSSDAHAATKAYVDARDQGILRHFSVRAATLTTDSGKTLATDFENTDTIDGVTLATGDHILIKDLSSGVQNGVYEVQATGAPVRVEYWETSDEVRSYYVFIEEGTANKDNGWVCTNDEGSDVVGTDALAFVQFSGAGQITAGTGMTKDANTLHVGDGTVEARGGIDFQADDIAVNVDGSTLEISSNAVQVADDGITGAKLASAVAGQGISQDGSGNLDLNINDLSNIETTIDDTDLVAIYEQDDGRTEKITRLNFLSGYSKENVTQVMHKVTAGEDAAGYLTLPSTPVNAASVTVNPQKGPQQVNKQVVGATGAVADFDIISSTQLHINNNGAATALSGDIKTNDILIIEYHVAA